MRMLLTKTHSTVNITITRWQDHFQPFLNMTRKLMKQHLIAKEIIFAKLRLVYLRWRNRWGSQTFGKKYSKWMGRNTGGSAITRWSVLSLIRDIFQSFCQSPFLSQFSGKRIQIRLKEIHSGSSYKKSSQNREKLSLLLGHFVIVRL